MTSSAAYAFVESVIVLLDRPGSIEVLRRFTWQLGLSLAAVPLALAVTPFGEFLVYANRRAAAGAVAAGKNCSLWLIIPLPALTATFELVPRDADQQSADAEHHRGGFVITGNCHYSVDLGEPLGWAGPVHPRLGPAALYSAALPGALHSDGSL